MRSLAYIAGAVRAAQVSMMRASIRSCAFGLFLVAGGCTHPGDGAKKVRAIDGPPPEHSHWVQGDRLRAVMRELESQLLTTWPQELDDSSAADRLRLRDKSYADARGLADGLATASRRIPEAVAAIRMAEVDRRSFSAQVDTLYEQSLRLKERAEAADYDGMRRALDSINETCLSCHQRFRDFAGPLDAVRADASSRR